MEELEVLPPLSPPHFHSGQTGMPPTLYCSLNPRQTHESKEKNVLAVHEQLTKEEQCESPTQWIQGGKKD